MTVQRSYENAEVGQQLYAILEAVKKPEVLWDKLTTGHYDWLGVRRNGRYVLGRPRLTPVRREDDGPIPDDEQHPHRLEFLGPLQKRPRWEAYPTAEAAREAYQQVVAGGPPTPPGTPARGEGAAREAYQQVVAGDPVTPLRNSGVWKVRLVVDGEPQEDLVVVRALPRLLCPGSAALADALRRARRRVLRRPRGAREDGGGPARGVPAFGDVVPRRLEGDDPVPAVLREPQRPRPGVDGAQPVAPADQVQHVDEAPHDVGDEAGELHAERVGDGGLVADGCHRALVEVLERSRGLFSAQACLDHLADVLALLHGRLGDPGELVQRDHVADREDLGVSRQRAVRVHRHATGTVGLQTGLLRQHPGQG